MKRIMLVFCLCWSGWAQGAGILATTSSFQRVYAIVPLIGKGTFDDPVRPMFVPAGGFKQNVPSIVERNIGQAKARTGIISYMVLPSDDSKSALVEFVSMDRAGLREILESKVAGVQVFERGRSARAEVEAAFKGKRRDFDFWEVHQQGSVGSRRI